MKHYFKHLPVLAVLVLFGALVLFSDEAAEGARQGLSVCAATLIPSLLPFFVLANLLASMGLPELLGHMAGGVMEGLFHISPAGAQAFFLGLSGGYPLGASVVADLRRSERVTKSEGERLLAFCNNSGPAFIIGAAGGVFQSPRAGILLYIAHVLGAVTVGVLLRGRRTELSAIDTPNLPEPRSFSAAFPAAVAKAVGSAMTVCGYVVLFSALLNLLTPLALLPPLPRAVVTGFLELGSGVSALAGLSPTPGALAAASFMLGWGGISVHCQTLGVLDGTDISCARHLLGRALCGLFSAGYTFLLARLL
ncbi:MAG: sporulation protein [Oscillospiraceae bacterium]|nr:sporulation protein [Oscillospiraceae bacterium]